MKKLNKGFTVIELLIVIAIIGILATTLAPKLLKEIRKATVAEVQHNLGVIRSRLSLDDTLSEEFPDFFTVEDVDKTDLLKSYSIEPTPGFTGADGVNHKETSQVVTPRDNTGGWFYIRETGEIYANLPNGAYTKDAKYEIWDELGSEDNNKPVDPDTEKNDWDKIEFPISKTSGSLTGSGGDAYELGGQYVVEIKPNIGWLPNFISGSGKLNGNYYVYIDDNLVNSGYKSPTQDGNSINVPPSRQEAGITQPKSLKVAFEYVENGVTKIIYSELELY
ncbi:type II secretion system protein [Psychrilyobacter atlanticus]|uniref:type II secretion system protein n=1 Tax=Psychrilyobacter atlanticus TaxID=271091 RepID=UPI00040CA025|nr:type II secretion system protein [Psychrilyobacter atlanticus]